MGSGEGRDTARCVPDGAGGAECECDLGYVGDGYSCEDVAVSLGGLRWEFPCTSHYNSYLCYAVNTSSISMTLGEDQDVYYDVTLRFRGVVEQKTYAGGYVDPMNPYWLVGGTPTSDPWNQSS